MLPTVGDVDWSLPTQGNHGVGPAPSERSLGMGRYSTAREFVRRGHGVTLVARSADKLESLATELAASGVRAEAISCDLSVRADRDALVAEVAKRGLGVSVLVNNAGLSTLGPIAESTVEGELNMVEVDVAAVVHLTTALLPQMVAAKAGGILNVASTAAFQPIPGQSGYAACKAFVLSYSKGLVGELRGSGVSVTALCPGPVDTGFGERAGFSKGDAEAALPSFMWESAEAVAKCGVDGLARGHWVAIPGPANRVAAAFAQIAPKRLLVPILARQHPGLK